LLQEAAAVGPAPYKAAVGGTWAKSRDLNIFRYWSHLNTQKAGIWASIERKAGQRPGGGTVAHSRRRFSTTTNVFRDLGLKDAEEKKTKVRLAVAINQILEKARLPQAEAAERLGINQPKISALANYRLEGFSVERLMNFLNALGRDVEIVIRRAKSRQTAGIHVTASRAAPGARDGRADGKAELT